jgi:hypothetical protein
MVSARALNRELGQSAVEFVVGLIVLVPIFLIVFDLSVIYAGVSFNDHVCREAARAAASGPPDAIMRGSPQLRAQATIAQADTNTAFQVTPECGVSENLVSMPKHNLGGPVEGSETVTTTVTVHPPFLIRCFVSKDGLQFSARKTSPITYVLSSKQERITPSTPDDSWQIAVSCKEMDHYLDFQGNSIKDVARLTVFYVNAGTSSSPKASPVGSLIHYEDLFFANQTAIGCNQFHELDVNPGTTGIIRVSASGSIDGYAVGNASGRLFLDLLRKRCVVRRVVVPESAFQDVINGFCRSGFHEEKDQLPGKPLIAALQVVSDPPGLVRSVLF